MHLANDGALEFPGQLQEALVGYGAPGFGFHGPLFHGDHGYLGGFLLVGGLVDVHEIVGALQGGAQQGIMVDPPDIGTGLLPRFRRLWRLLRGRLPLKRASTTRSCRLSGDRRPSGACQCYAFLGTNIFAQIILL